MYEKSLVNGFIVCLITLLSFSTQVSAASTEMGIVTGGIKGTYIKIGKDISNLVERYNVNLNVYSSNGSLDNVADVYERRGVQLGIVQSDVLSFIKGNSEDQKLERIADKIKMVFPLYNEEVHILANQSINSFADLKGTMVAIGKDGSGTFLTAELMFEASGVRPNKKVTSGGKEALDMLLDNKIDAMFYVSGYPVKLFTDITEEKIHLVNIRDKNISEFYTESTIPRGTYPFQDNDVETVAVKAVLMSYDYKRAHCQNVGKVAKVIYDNFRTLQSNGHPKWKEVDLDYKLKKWDQYSCVQNELAKHSRSNPPSGDRNNSTKSLLRKTLGEMGN